MPKKYDHIDFKPPASVASQAEKGLRYRQKASPANRGGLTPAEAGKQGIGSGVQRATNLKSRDTLSPETVRQMGRFFSRHEKNKSISAENKNEPWNDKGHVAWLLWGGDAGKAWADRIIGQMDKADSAKKAALEGVCWEGFEAFGLKEKDGKKVPNCIPKTSRIRSILAEEGLLSSRKADKDGSYMSVQALKTLIDNCEMLLEHIDESTPLDDWMEAKLTRANNDIRDVAEYYSKQE